MLELDSMDSRRLLIHFTCQAHFHMYFRESIHIFYPPRYRTKREKCIEAM